MKSLTLFSACALLAVGAWAQGTVNFVNYVPASGINAPVTDAADGAKLEGAGWKINLFAGPEGTAEGSLTAVGDPVVGFRSGAAAGYWSVISKTVNGVAGGSPAAMQVRVWDAQYASYDAAVAAGGKAGKSGVFTTATGGGGTPPGPPLPMIGLTAFSVAGTVIPEPSTIALGMLGAAALMFRRRK